MSSMKKCLQHFSFAHSVIWKLFVEDTQCIQHCAACLLECSWFLQFSHGDRYYSHNHTRFIAKNQKLVQNEDNMIWKCLTERPSFIWNIRGRWERSKGWGKKEHPRPWKDTPGQEVHIHRSPEARRKIKHTLC